MSWDWEYFITRRTVCPTCKGVRGNRDNGGWERCPDCRGKGIYEDETSLDIALVQSQVIKDLCGFVDELKRRKDEGKGDCEKVPVLPEQAGGD